MFLTTSELTLVAKEYIRIQEWLRVLYSSHDKEHDGYAYGPYFLLISVSVAKLWPL